MKKNILIVIVLFFSACSEKNTLIYQIDEGEEIFQSIYPSLQDFLIKVSSLAEYMSEEKREFQNDIEQALNRDCPDRTTDLSNFPTFWTVTETSPETGCINAFNREIKDSCQISFEGALGSGDVTIQTGDNFGMRNISNNTNFVELKNAIFKATSVSDNLVGVDRHFLHNIKEIDFNILDGKVGNITSGESGTITYVDTNDNGTDSTTVNDDYQIISITELPFVVDEVTFYLDIISIKIGNGVCGSYCPYGGSIMIRNSSKSPIYIMSFGGGTETCGDVISVLDLCDDSTFTIECQI